VPVVRRAEQEEGRIDRAAGDDDDVGAIRLALAVAIDDHAVDGAAALVRLEPLDLRVRHEGDVRVLEGGPDAEDVRIRLCLDEAGETVEPRTAHAGALQGILLVEIHPDRQVEGLVAGADEVVVELLDPRLVADRRIGVRPGGGRLGRILPALAVDEVEALRLVVVGREVLVRERPRGRDAGVVANLAEVPFAEPEEDGAVHLRLATDVVVLAGMERLPVLVVPGLVRLVLVLDEDGVRVPVVRLAGQVVAALEEEDALPRRRQSVRERSPSRAGADDDDVVVIVHAVPPVRRVRSVRPRRP
jgi:hypothetical protein